MLHLVPIRLLLTAQAFVAMSAYALAFQAGLISNANWMEVASGVLKIATPAALASMVVALAAWRWSPTFMQTMLFPYLGGEWSGEIEFSEQGQLICRPARLDVSHTLTSIRFVLRTTESTSATLMVHARKIPDVRDIVKLVYIYEVERHEGHAGAGDRYRGCAFIDVQLGERLTMSGSYMASSNRSGAIRMTLMARTAWWKLWR
ncbi:MAG TPA: hypothetical protein VF601_15180 [Beijerinckiaceae bacterium]